MSVEIEIADIKAEARNVRRDVDELRHTLYGNGSPGMKSALQDLTHQTVGLRSAIEELRNCRAAEAEMGMKWKLAIGGTLLAFCLNLLKDFVT